MLVIQILRRALWLTWWLYDEGHTIAYPRDEIDKVSSQKNPMGIDAHRWVLIFVCVAHARVRTVGSLSG